MNDSFGRHQKLFVKVRSNDSNRYNDKLYKIALQTRKPRRYAKQKPRSDANAVDAHAKNSSFPDLSS